MPSSKRSQATLSETKAAAIRAVLTRNPNATPTEIGKKVRLSYRQVASSAPYRTHLKLGAAIDADLKRMREKEKAQGTLTTVGGTVVRGHMRRSGTRNGKVASPKAPKTFSELLTSLESRQKIVALMAKDIADEVAFLRNIVVGK